MKQTFIITTSRKLSAEELRGCLEDMLTDKEIIKAVVEVQK